MLEARCLGLRTTGTARHGLAARWCAVLLAVLLTAGCSTMTAGTAAGPTNPASSAPNPPAGTSGSPRSAATVATTATVTTTVTGRPSSPQTPTAPTTPPATPPTDLAGEVYGFITAVDVAKSQITLDKVDWFTGAAAQQACAADGVTRTDNNWCTGYYYRNVNPALRVVAFSPGAAISTLDGSQDVPSDLSTVASRVGATGGTSPYHLVVTDGAITDLREIYRP